MKTRSSSNSEIENTVYICLPFRNITSQFSLCALLGDAYLTTWRLTFSRCIIILFSGPEILFTYLSSTQIYTVLPDRAPPRVNMLLGGVKVGLEVRTWGSATQDLAVLAESYYISLFMTAHVRNHSFGTSSIAVDTPVCLVSRI